MNEMVHSVRKAPKRTNDPERTMAGIMAVATQEFAAKGLAGARIDAIAAATHTSKRMIYYYYGSKEGLYAYRRIRATEAEVHLADLSPVEALKALVGFTFDHHHSNQDFVRLVISENMQCGEYLAQSKLIQELNVSVIQAIEALYKRGVKAGVFRKGLDPIDIHASISALTFFNVSNRYTFDLIFKRNGQTAKALAARRQSVVEMVLRFVSYSNLA
jgi:AcrR family transcriptional regulator